MSRSQFPSKTRLGLLTIALVGGINMTSAAFAVDAMPQGYQLASAQKAGEGKCGEGKCGASGAKATQTEGKCGEGKCGADGAQAKATQAEGKCGRASVAMPPLPVPTPTMMAGSRVPSCWRSRPRPMPSSMPSTPITTALRG